MSALRRAGSPWRILVHEWLGGQQLRRLHYGRAYDIGNIPDAPRRRAETMRKIEELSPAIGKMPDGVRHTILEGTEFDELVVGRWIHLEQMDAGKWWMNVGGVTIDITADRDGHPIRVLVQGPEDYAGPVDGCTYELIWSEGSALHALMRLRGHLGARTGARNLTWRGRDRCPRALNLCSLFSLAPPCQGALGNGGSFRVQGGFAWRTER